MKLAILILCGLTALSARATATRLAPNIANKGIVSAAAVISAGLVPTPLYITPTQLSVVAPPGLAGARETNLIVEMNFVWPARPGLFTACATGKGPAAAGNQNATINTPQNPAKKGEIVVLWRAGECESPEGVTIALRE